ncbi:hypothetical protein ASC98_16105 [Rhizobacter sp. Root1238]|nr:hypothetical protein ASC98_16105 [Rhizobacter sp. Root1238]
MPPLCELMPTETAWSPWVYASSARTAKAALVPLDWPAAIVMVWPLLRVSTSGEPVTAWSTLAV